MTPPTHRVGPRGGSSLLGRVAALVGDRAPELALPVGVGRLLARRRLSGVSPLALVRYLRDRVAFGGGGPQGLLHLHALDGPDRPALVDGELRLTFRDLDRRIFRLAHGLRALGVGPGDKVATLLANSHHCLELAAALGYLGAALVQIGYRLKAREVGYLLRDSGARALVFHAEFEATVEEALVVAGNPARASCYVVGRAAPQPPDGAGPSLPFANYERLLDAGDPDAPPRVAGGGSAQVITYTSGTTGHVKGASRDLGETGFGPILNFLADLPLGHDERHLVLCPLYHSMAPFFASATLGYGGAVVIGAAHFDPLDVLRTIERERITSTLVVPTMLARLLSVGPTTLRSFDLSSLRAIVSGAAPLPTELARGVEEAFGPILYNFYGSTETGLVTLALPGEHTARAGTVGRLVFGNLARLLDDQGRDVPEGEVGELYVKNAMTVGGYHKNPEATRAALRDGYFSVGDLARRDADGYYYLADRKHDLVISGGVNIYPWEIEQRLYEHPAIADVAVVGVPDPEWGESIAAFVVVRPGMKISDEEVRRHVVGALADYKKPRRVIFVDALPRSPTGKVQKRELRERIS